MHYPASIATVVRKRTGNRREYFTALTLPQSLHLLQHQPLQLRLPRIQLLNSLQPLPFHPDVLPLSLQIRHPHRIRPISPLPASPTSAASPMTWPPSSPGSSLRGASPLSRALPSRATRRRSEAGQGRRGPTTGPGLLVFPGHLRFPCQRLSRRALGQP